MSLNVTALKGDGVTCSIKIITDLTWLKQLEYN